MDLSARMIQLLPKVIRQWNYLYLQREAKIFVSSLRTQLDQGPHTRLLHASEGSRRCAQPRQMQHVV